VAHIKKLIKRQTGVALAVNHWLGAGVYIDEDQGGFEAGSNFYILGKSQARQKHRCQ
jgi:hypothetical protein